MELDAGASAWCWCKYSAMSWHARLECSANANLAVLVHKYDIVANANVVQCCGMGAGHLATEAVLLLQSKLFRVMCEVTEILQELL